jgi:hypothetical protein
MHPIAIWALAFAPEVLLFHFAPGQLAQAAFLPFGERRRVELGDAARRLLHTTAPRALTYRAPPGDAADLTRLEALFPDGKQSVTDGAVWAAPNAGRMVLRVKPAAGFFRRPWMIARIDLHVRADAIELEVRYLPHPFFSWILAAATITAMDLADGRLLRNALPISIALGCAVVSAASARWRNRGPVREALDLLAQRLQEGPPELGWGAAVDNEEGAPGVERPRMRRRYRRR